MSTPKSIDEYIAAAPEEVRPILESIRATVRNAAPDAEERISYRMPAFFQDGALVYFAAFKSHIGLYPPVRDEALLPLVEKFRRPKGQSQVSVVRSHTPRSNQANSHSANQGEFGGRALCREGHDQG